MIGFTWAAVGCSWDEKFALLKVWHSQFGDCCVPISEAGLGTWVSKQRTARHSGLLPPDKIAALDALGFTWNTTDAEWDARIVEYRGFVRREGHGFVPFKTGGLGWWANTQRQVRKNGMMTVERARRLDAAGFAWKTPSSWPVRIDNRIIGKKKWVHNRYWNGEHGEWQKEERSFDERASLEGDSGEVWGLENATEGDRNGSECPHSEDVSSSFTTALGDMGESYDWERRLKESAALSMKQSPSINSAGTADRFPPQLLSDSSYFIGLMFNPSTCNLPAHTGFDESFFSGIQTAPYNSMHEV